MTGPSVWWPVPHDPRRWFSEAEISASTRYHQPLRHAAVLRESGRIALLLGAVALLRSADRGGSGDDIIRLGMVIAAVITGAAWSLPAVAADAWFEYVHEPRFGHHPVAWPRFAVVAAISIVSATVVSGVAGAATIALLRSPATPLLVGLLASAAGLLVARIGGRLLTMAVDVQPIDDLPDRARIDGLVAGRRSGVATVGVASESAVTGLTAFVAGSRRRRTLALSEDLVAADPAVRGHVVAHELAHLRRRDLGVSMTVGALMDLVVVTTAVALVRSGVDPQRLDVGGIDADMTSVSALPVLGLAVMVSGAVAALPTAWLSRAHERRADRDAARWTPAASDPTVPISALRQIHVTDRADLDPPRWAGLFATHPSPGERLELLHHEVTAGGGRLPPNTGRSQPGAG